MKAAPIEGQKLTSWGVLPGGTQIALDFVAIDGGTHRIVLPFDALSGLMMTLPRMLQSALDERFPDGGMRIVQPLGTMAAGTTEPRRQLYPQARYADGFEVAFALNGEACRLTRCGAAARRRAKQNQPW